jgi:hypothetical protein
MGKVTVSETKEIGSQNLGSKTYQYSFLYTRFINSFVFPTQSTKFRNFTASYPLQKTEPLAREVHFE